MGSTISHQINKIGQACSHQIKMIQFQFADSKKKQEILQVRRIQKQQIQKKQRSNRNLLLQTEDQIRKRLQARRKEQQRKRLQVQRKEKNENDYKQKKKEQQIIRVDNLAYNYLNNRQCQQCPHCSFWVERIYGCNTMACRCGTIFCYLCGKLYQNHKKCI